MKKDINNYQFLLMQAVMEVWEPQLLQAKYWNTCWPTVVTDRNINKGKLRVRLITGTGFLEEDVNKFKAIYIERFGKFCAPAQGKILTYKKNNIRYLLWQEARKNWPTPDFRLDCKWYYEKIGKQWPADILDFGHIIYDDDEFLSNISMSVEEAYRSVENGEMEDSKTIAALMMAQKYIRKSAA